MRLSPGSKLTVLVTVCVDVACEVTVTDVVLVIPPGPEVIRHEQAEDSDEIPRPRDMSACRFLTGSSEGQETS